MVQYSAVLPPRFSNRALEWTTPYAGLVFSNSNLRGRDTLPGAFGASSGSGGPAFVTIDAIPAAVQDQEVLAMFAVNASNEGSCCVRGDKGSNLNPDGVTRAHLTSATNLTVRTRHSAGAFETNGNIDLTGVTFPILVRLQVVGTGTTTIRCKAWSIFGPEPGAWGIDTTSTRPRADGYPGLFRQGNGLTDLSHHSAGTLGDPAPDFMGLISGTVVENPGAVPVARLVRAVNRVNPDFFYEVMSDGAGVYAVPGLLGVEHSVYAMDADFNAPILDRIVPV